MTRRIEMRPRVVKRLSALAAAVALAFPMLFATGPAPAAEAPVADTSQDSRADALRGQLQDLRRNLDASQTSRRRLQGDVDAIRDDRARLKEALIATAKRIDTAGAKLDEGQVRLDTLTGSEAAIRKSLETRRGVLGEILAALQRMGRAAPPALLVRPDDLLGAVHASILLGAVLPEMRSEAEALADDLRQLVTLRTAIVAERETAKRDLANLEEERTHLTLLTEARQKAQGETESALDVESQRASELGRQATSVETLISRLEEETAAAQKAQEAAHLADSERDRQAALETRDQQARIAASPFKDAARLAPAIAFADAKGRLPLPVAGSVVRPWGIADGFGSTEKGVSISARPGAPVASPADGWVIYAAPYRSYGQLIVVNVGGGYHIVLAGLEKVSVSVGQFVLSGEPVGTMGNGAARTAAAIAIGASTPILYVEFRKDGSAIDPSPWWAQPETQRVRG